MGVGNYWLENAKTVYIDFSDVYGDDEEYSDEFRLTDFIEQLTSIIPLKSFYATERRIYARHGTRLIVAENGWYQLSLVHWHTYIAINVELKPGHYSDPWECNPLGIFHHANTARKIFNALSEYFPLRVRTSSCTSGPYQAT